MIRNKATGRLLSMSGNTITGAAANTGSYQRWQVGYTVCEKIDIDDIVATPGETVYYSDLDIVLNGGNSTPTNATSTAIYTVSASPSGSVSFGTSGMTINSSFPGDEITVTFGRKDTTATCTFKMPVCYSIETMASKIGELFDVAYDYYSGNNYPDSYGHYYDSIVSTLTVIREGAYSGMFWNVIAGAGSADLENLIENQYPELHSFFNRSSSKLYTKDPITGKKIDIVHMAATLNALYYTGSTTIENIIYTEEIVDDLSGWAGDFQSLIVDYYDQEYGYSDYDAIYSAFFSMIGDSAFSFSYDDFPAGMDAINLRSVLTSSITSGTALKNAILAYYTGTAEIVASNRVTNIIGNYGRETLYSKISPYADTNYNTLIPWLLITDNYSGTISDTESRAFAYAFTDYLIEQRETEA